MAKMSLEISAIRKGLKRELCDRIYRFPMGGHFEVTLNGPRNIAYGPMETQDPLPIGVSFKEHWLVTVLVKENGTWRISHGENLPPPTFSPILEGDFMNPEAFKIITDTVEKTVREKMEHYLDTLVDQVKKADMKEIFRRTK